MPSTTDVHELSAAKELVINANEHRFSYIDEGSTYSSQDSTPRRYCYFSDGRRRVDFVLAYEDTGAAEDFDEEDVGSDSDDLYTRLTGGSKEPAKTKQRRFYEENLLKKGLELEFVKGQFCTNTNFVLVHIPFDLLCLQAEKLGIEMRVLPPHRPERVVLNGPLDNIEECCHWFRFDEETNALLSEPRNIYHPFMIDYMRCYVGHDDPENFFSSGDRVFAVHDILCRASFGKGARIGLEQLLKREIYSAAYPVHEYLDLENIRSGLFKREPIKTADELRKGSNRQLLYWLWAKLRYCFKFQPHYIIKEYFGSKLLMYFMLVGYYSRFLFPWAFLGLLCYLYGFITFSSDIPSRDMCASDGVGATTLMCPTCDQWCDYTLLKSSCFYSMLSYIFDNIATITFATAMSIGATFFIEGWKRYNTEMGWRLGLLDTGSHSEGMRLAYLLQSLRSSHIRDAQTQQCIPVVIPLMRRIPRILASGATVLFFLCLITAAVVGTIIYRLVMMQVLYRVDSMRPFASIFVAITTAVLNLVVILIMSYFYSYLALKLTDWEYPRTQSEFENSYTIKVFAFQFINYYSSIFYVAFFKGNFSGLPDRRVLGLRPEDCDASGCMVELAILITTIMLGKTVYNILLELFNPVLLMFCRSMTLKIPETRRRALERWRRKRRKEMNSTLSTVPRWEYDYALTPVYDQFLFDDYLDVAMQFGFVTLFAAAFPLAPFIAFFNNLLEGRLDAYKYVVAMRRPIPERAKDIGIWLSILKAISIAAVLTNAFVIAFTSDFIPRYVYLKQHADLYGYVNSTLSLFESSSLSPPYWSKWKNITSCWFRGYHKPPCSLLPFEDCDDRYDVTNMWWIVLAYRLGFVAVFAHVVFAVKWLVAYVIPDMPSRVFIEMMRQRSTSDQLSVAGDI